MSITCFVSSVVVPLRGGLRWDMFVMCWWFYRALPSPQRHLDLLPSCGFLSVSVRINLEFIGCGYLLVKRHKEQQVQHEENVTVGKKKDSDGLLSIMKIREEKADSSIFAPHTQIQRRGTKVSGRCRVGEKKPFLTPLPKFCSL
jgi:hypothetical protein